MKIDRAFRAYMEDRITREEYTRYVELHTKLMGTHSFVEVDDSNPEWNELSILTTKIYKS